MLFQTKWSRGQYGVGREKRGDIDEEETDRGNPDRSGPHGAGGARVGGHQPGRGYARTDRLRDRKRGRVSGVLPGEGQLLYPRRPQQYLYESLRRPQNDARGAQLELSGKLGREPSPPEGGGVA